MENNIPKENIKIAIVGCGRISGHHFRSIESIDGMEIIAFCDLIKDKAKAYGEEFGISYFTNYHKMFEILPEINLVVVATPSGMHYEHSLEFLERYRKHVIIEKPTFMRPDQLKNTYNIADRFGLYIFPVFQNRYNKAVQRVKNALINGELGNIRIVNVRLRWCRPQRYYDMAPWRGTFSHDGGATTNQGIHHLDLLRYLAGEIKKVNAQIKTVGVDVEVEGFSGHGSRPYKDHPNEILISALNKIKNWKTPLQINPVIDEMFYRVGLEIGGIQGFVLKNIDNDFIRYFVGENIANSNPSTNAMLRNTIAITMINSGYKTNIIPEKANATLDIRLLPFKNPNDFINDVKNIVNDPRVKFIPKRTPENEYISNWDTDFFNILSKKLKNEDPNSIVVPFMTIGGTDSQFFQAKGINCYGLLPIMVSESDIQSIHGIDERISIENLMFGLKVVYSTIKEYTNLNN